MHDDVVRLARREAAWPTAAAPRSRRRRGGPRRRAPSSPAAGRARTASRALSQSVVLLSMWITSGRSRRTSRVISTRKRGFDGLLWRGQSSRRRSTSRLELGREPGVAAARHGQDDGHVPRDAVGERDRVVLQLGDEHQRLHAGSPIRRARGDPCGERRASSLRGGRDGHFEDVAGQDRRVHPRDDRFGGAVGRAVDDDLRLQFGARASRPSA